MMLFHERYPALSSRAKRLVMTLTTIGCLAFSNTMAVASEGDGAEGASYHFNKVSFNEVTITETSQNVNGVTTSHNGTLDVVFGGGNESNTSGAEKNNVMISGGTMTAVFGGMSSSGGASMNQVTVTDGVITEGVSGGATFFNAENSTAAGHVMGNTVTIRGGQVAHVSGGEIGYAYPTGENSTPDLTQSYFSAGGDASRNHVTVTGGKVTGGIVGGASLTGSATENSINIEGGTVSGDVIAGEVRYPMPGSSATGNRVTISGSPDLSGATIKGGVMGSVDSPAGNSLNINTKDLTAQNISGFQELNIDLPSDTKSGDTVLTLTNSAGTDLSDMDIRVGKRWDGGSNDFSNSTIALITNPNGGITTNSGTRLSDYLYDGVTLQYPLLGGGASADGRSYTATLGTPSVNPATQTATATLMVPAMIVSNQPVHMPDPDPERWDYEPLGEETESNKAEGKDEKPVAMSVSPFFDISGSSMRENTGYGSYIDVDSVGMDAGISFARNNRHGRLVFAPIIDYGNGNYDTYLSDGTHGNGNAKFWAAGMIVRQTNFDGLYYEGSLRMGRANVDFLSGELRNEGDAPVSFHSSASVLTGHLRIGKVMKYGPSNTLHVYGLYTHTHQGSMDADLSTGEHYRFAAVDNGRLRIGARLTWQKNKNQRFYTELAYQYTRNGDASASCDGFDIPKSGQNGSSGMLQIGWQIRPNPATPWALNLSATGWMGMQKGVSAQLRLTKSF